MFEWIERDEVNVGRQTELDIAKGIAVIFMIICHSVITLSPNDTGSIWYLIGNSIMAGPLAAPVFMTCLGIGLCFSKNNTPEKMRVRGLKLLLVAYMLNLMRDFIPNLIWAIINDGYDSVDLISNLLNVDILHFSGMVFIFFSIAFKFRLSIKSMVAIAVASSIIGNIVAGNSTGILVLDGIGGLVWGTGKISAFPFMNWLIFPVFGLGFGKILLKTNDKVKLYKYCILLGLFLCTFILFDSFEFTDIWYYHLGLAQALCYIGIVIIGFSIYFWISCWIPNSLKNVLSKLSSRVNEIYCLHWVIIGWLSVLLIKVYGYDGISAASSFIIGILITIVSYLGVDGWKIYKVKAKRI